MRKKYINLTISNKQYSEKLEPKGETFTRKLNLEDEIELTTEGVLYKKNNATYITYNESSESGLENMKTMLKIANGKILIRRFAKNSESKNMDMLLEEGVMNITRYSVTPAGILEMEIYTNSVKENLSEEGYGSIFADYKIKMEPLINVRNQLEIFVKPN